MQATTIPAVLHRAAAEFGAEEAIVDGEVRLGFVGLEAAVDEIARALIGSGVRAGDRVAIWAPNSARWITVCCAIYAVGGVNVPLNTRYKGVEAGHVLRTSGARLLFTTTDFLGVDHAAMLWDVADLDAIEEVVVLHGPDSAGTTSWNEFLGRAVGVDVAAVREREAALDPDDPCDIIFTSGTTGAPKGAVLTHAASVRTYLAWCERVGLRRGDRYVVVYPFFHTAGLKSGVLSCLLVGATSLPAAVFDVPAVMRTVAAERVTVLPGPPTVFQTILNDPGFATFDLSSLRLGVTGAAVVPVEVIRRMKDELALETVVTGYGLTETTGTVTMCRHDDPPDVIASTVGKPLPGLEVKVVDDDGVALGSGIAGEILVRGYNLMREYFDDPVATARAIDAEGWLRTGDVGFVDDDGNLHITDRKKDMFIVGGFNAYPAEIESLMLAHPSIAQVAVIGAPDERLGEVGVAFVVPRAGTAPDPHEIVEWCRANMANFKVPRRVNVVESLPLNPSGKVMKFALRDLVTPA